MACLR